MADNTADNGKRLNTAVNDQIRQMQQNARQMSQTVKDVERFGQALDDASNNAIDRATESIKKLLKSTGVLTDVQAENIKSVRNVNSLLHDLAMMQAELTEAQQEYNAALKKGTKDGKLSVSAQNAAQLELSKRLAKLKINVDSTSDAADVLADNLKRLKTVNAGVNEETKRLSSVSSKAGKALDNVRSNAVAAAEKFATFATVTDLAGDAMKAVYAQATRLSDKGMVMAMKAINLGALKLKLSVEEFEKLVQGNMDLVRTFGGGAEGIERFTDEVKSASIGLEYLGKNAAEFAVKNMEVLKRAGIAASKTDPMKDMIYRKNMKEMNRQFKLFQAGFGDTIEDFTSYYDTLLQSDEIQQRMNSLDSQGIDLMMDEIRQRTENMRIMGLTTKQMEEMNRTLDSMYNPRKNNQSERISQAANFKNFVNTTANYASDEDRQLILANSDKVERMARAMQLGDKNTLSNEMADAQGQKLSEALKRANDQLMQRSIDEGKIGMPIASNAFREAAGPYLEMLMKQGDISIRNASSNKNNQVGSPEAEEFKKSVYAVTGEGSKLAESFFTLRGAVDQVNSVLSVGAPFMSGLGALTAAVLLTSNTLRTKFFSMLTNVAKNGISMSSIMRSMGTAIRAVSIGMGGLGGILTGLGSVFAAWLAAVGLDKLIGYMGLGNKTIDEQTDDANWDKMTIGERIESGLARSIEKVGGFMMYDNMSNEARSKRIQTETAHLKSQGRAPTTATQPPASASQRTSTGSIASPAAGSLTPLADLIARGESGSAGYNASNKGTVGNRIIAGNKEDLSKMTIGQVMQRQALPAGDTNRLFAVGRYQMVPETFKEAVRYLKLDPNTQYTPEVQDQMFQYLVMKKRPAVANYLNGKSNDVNGAVAALSQEWAAVANPNSGKSAYANGNKSSISTDETIKALEQARRATLAKVNGVPVTAVATPSIMTTTAPSLADTRTTGQAVNGLFTGQANPVPLGVSDTIYSRLQTGTISQPVPMTSRTTITTPQLSNANPIVSSPQPTVQSSSSTTQSKDKDGEILAEMKKQTGLLSTVAANTIKGPLFDRSLYKQSQESSMAASS
jgi:hypothetical protein